VSFLLAFDNIVPVYTTQAGASPLMLNCIEVKNYLLNGRDQ
jgi:hypothetical protein